MKEETHSRRRFLRYAGSGLAAAAVVAGGYYYYNHVRGPDNNLIATTTPSSTSPTPTIPMTQAPSTTSPSGQLAFLNGRLFYDYNGNGKQDMGEPSIANAKVRLVDVQGKLISEAVTDSGGSYKLEDFPEGNYTLSVAAEEKFRWMCRSLSDLSTTTRGYSLDLKGEQTINFGLMEGPLTVPFYEPQFILDYVDVDPRVGYIRDWMGTGHTYDGHFGTDYSASIGVPVCAAAPAVIHSSSLTSDYPVIGGGNFVATTDDYGLRTEYLHLSKVADNILPGVTVKRGEIIGFVGDTGNASGNPHLHFQVGKSMWLMRNSVGRAIDPYRDLYYNPKYGWNGMDSTLCSNPISLWTEDNKPNLPQKV